MTGGGGVVAIVLDSVVGAVKLAPKGKVIVAVCGRSKLWRGEKATSTKCSGLASPLVSRPRRKRTFGSKAPELLFSPGTMNPCTPRPIINFVLSFGSRKK